MEESEVLSKVQKLIRVAQDPATPPETAKAYQEKADKLMELYAIEEAQLDLSRPEAERAKPGTLEFEVGRNDDIVHIVAGVASTIARHCRCKVRHYTSYRFENGKPVYISKAYGYESDLRYFEFLYTTVRLHMTAILRPVFDPEKPLGETAYSFHEAGYNWLEIAKIMGWEKRKAYLYPDVKYPYYNKRTTEVLGYDDIINPMRKAYREICKEKGHQPTKIQPNGGKTYRVNAAEGYWTRIGQRLREIEGKRGTGSELVLRRDSLEEFYKSENPDLFAAPCPECAKAKSGHCRKHPKGRADSTPFNSDAYAAGSSHANSADLGGPKAESRKASAIEG
jgi:hypothetical protein